MFLMADILFGSDLNIRSLSQGAVVNLDESKIREAIVPHLAENGGDVQSFTMLSSTISLQMMSKGREPVKEFVLGTGLIQEKSAIKKLSVTSIEPVTLDTMKTENIFYPQDWVTQPFGANTKVYSQFEMTQMMQDMAEQS